MFDRKKRKKFHAYISPLPFPPRWPLSFSPRVLPLHRPRVSPLSTDRKFIPSTATASGGIAVLYTRRESIDSRARIWKHYIFPRRASLPPSLLSIKRALSWHGVSLFLCSRGGDNDDDFPTPSLPPPRPSLFLRWLLRAPFPTFSRNNSLLEGSWLVVFRWPTTVQPAVGQGK